MARVIGNPRQSLDQLGHSGQRPQICPETVSSRPRSQCLIHSCSLPGIKLGEPAGATGGAKGSCPAFSPLLIPTADTLTAHLQDTGDPCLGLTPGEPSPCLLATLFQRLKVTSGTISNAGHAPIIHTRKTIVTILCEIQQVARFANC
jgi:hypothetical protein